MMCGFTNYSHLQRMSILKFLGSYFSNPSLTLTYSNFTLVNPNVKLIGPSKLITLNKITYVE